MRHFGGWICFSIPLARKDVYIVGISDKVISYHVIRISMDTVQVKFSHYDCKSLGRTTNRENTVLCFLAVIPVCYVHIGPKIFTNDARCQNLLFCCRHAACRILTWVANIWNTWHNCSSVLLFQLEGGWERNTCQMRGVIMLRKHQRKGRNGLREEDRRYSSLNINWCVPLV